MKYLVLLGIVVVLVLGALIALRMVRTAHRKKDEWKVLTNRATLAESTISQIDKELDVAKSAGMSVDAFILGSIINDYSAKRASTNVKEIAS